ncbi:transcriptional regulator [Vibrio orientalis CIP 102891 = ATCC 33934]|uniref:Transcriptional regulator n=1 Tax=Vibrio orientalis CIP 102891 = ATCC 33934 TaxID=675816 RepID=C9QGJ6_VIBOR|nr:helix-turn-helix domain-containing protein [Vibrio orientalis]EEX93770.1 transcriptional regulator XRE family [Vibrio orientalis CIP 102891 = ATCC 33934]EGU50778.1 transcriptional regulator [Vibrio orientalis CIP 102891 = ATCC 33934]
MQENYQDRIILVMKERGESNASLAEGIGKGKATIGRYLAKGANRTHPSVEELEDIAAYLNVEPHWLISGIGDRHTKKEAVNKMVEGGAATVNIYHRSDVNSYLEGNSVNIVGTMPVAKEHADCFAVVYPVTGIVSITWDCAALIMNCKQWQNDDIVLARIGSNPAPDFYTLVRIADKVHVWRGEDTTKNAVSVCDESDIDLIGVTRWGIWNKRT